MVVTLIPTLRIQGLGGGRGVKKSFPACAFLSSSGDQLARTNSTLSAKISPQWLSELIRLWTSVP